MSLEITKIRALQQQTQAAYKKAEEANNAAAMAELEVFFKELVQLEAQLISGSFAVEAAAIAALADRLEQATKDIDNKIDTFFADDLKAVAADLVDDRTATTEVDNFPTAIAESEDAGPDAIVPTTKASYAKAFALIKIRADKHGEIDFVISLITKPANLQRYREVENTTGVPHWVVGILHLLEASLNFKTHLHNGDPLSAPTVRVPKGRPKTWRPGINWAESAADALTGEGRDLDQVKNWSVGAALEVLERYNGLGYRNRGLMTPYLWAGSEYYEKGKFVADGRFDPEATTKQIGAASILKRMEDRDLISISGSRKAVTILPAAVLDNPELDNLNLDGTELKHAKAELDFPAKTVNAKIKKGTIGMGARRIQEWCSLHGIATAIDNNFGEATVKSIERFQRERHLKVTGDVDRITWALLTEPMRKALQPVEGAEDWSELLLMIARQHVAQNPTERGGNNFGPWVRLYMRGNQGTDQLWCAGFVCTLAAQAARDLGINMPIKRRIGVDALVRDAKADSRFLSESNLSVAALRPSKVKPGMMFAVRKTATDWTHVGLVTKVSKDTFSTIEGNTNGENNDGGEAKASTRSYNNKDFLSFF